MSSISDPELSSILYPSIFSYDELFTRQPMALMLPKNSARVAGSVYKGELKDGRVVAVKRLFENNYRRLEQFMNEVKILSLLCHPNLVRLYGCTSRRSRELLLTVLPWHTRMRIAIETADALHYLHSTEPPIIHRDVKTNNILLDKGFHVKVADFASRLVPVDATHVSTAPQGTPGYVDPEYHRCFQLTDRSDVYSFGVVLLELISSKPALDVTRER
ncbi:hypothetical protein HPP92_021377 [Vanilla planifolia]|uniref:Protein kinase domain-containing protein n=1 Tax=Vanilla planifolia TaxID=51239 RepID=A0A835Q2F0_VANPL|nr:hypothetical protein HPP92_021377 [Vanilla planifolia]